MFLMSVSAGYFMIAHVMLPAIDVIDIIMHADTHRGIIEFFIEVLWPKYYKPALLDPWFWISDIVFVLSMTAYWDEISDK